MEGLEGRSRDIEYALAATTDFQCTTTLRQLFVSRPGAKVMGPLFGDRRCPQDGSRAADISFTRREAWTVALTDTPPPEDCGQDPVGVSRRDRRQSRRYPYLPYIDNTDQRSKDYATSHRIRPVMDYILTAKYGFAITAAVAVLGSRNRGSVRAARWHAR